MNVITQCNRPNLSNKYQHYSTTDYPIISFTSNNPIVTCMGTQVSFRKLITIAKKFTLLLDIHRSKLAYIILVDARFGKTQWSMVKKTMVNNIFSIRKKPKKKQSTRGIGIKQTSETKHSHTWTRAYNLLKCKTPNPLENYCCCSFLKLVCGTKECNNCTTIWTCPFLPWLPNMNNRFCHLLIELFLLSKQLWMCSLHMIIVGIIPLTFMYLIKPFWKVDL